MTSWLCFSGVRREASCYAMAPSLPKTPELCDSRATLGIVKHTHTHTRTHRCSQLHLTLSPDPKMKRKQSSNSMKRMTQALPTSTEYLYSTKRAASIKGKDSREARSPQRPGAFCCSRMPRVRTRARPPTPPSRRCRKRQRTRSKRAASPAVFCVRGCGAR